MYCFQKNEAIMEKFLILSHIVCGASVLILGLIQMFNRKGSKNHLMLGKIYVGAMWWICLSALAIISFYRFSAFLMVISVMTFYSSFVGVRVLRRRIPGSEKWYDWAVAIITGMFGAGLIIYGVYAMNMEKSILGILCIMFGSFTSYNALQDLHFFTKKEVDSKQWWLLQHISAMGGSYIAAVTAFAVQNPEIFVPNSSYQWLLWLAPGIVGAPIIGRIKRKYKRKANPKFEMA